MTHIVTSKVDNKPPCGFCGGKPVGNAARWYSLPGSVPDYLPCPRCGKTNDDEKVI